MTKFRKSKNNNLYKKLLEIILGMNYSHGHRAGVAQLVEHLIRNEGVVGSSPITGTINTACQGAGFFYYTTLAFYVNTLYSGDVMKQATIIIIK